MGFLALESHIWGYGAELVDKVPPLQAQRPEFGSQPLLLKARYDCMQPELTTGGVGRDSRLL